MERCWEAGGAFYWLATLHILSGGGGGTRGARRDRSAVAAERDGGGATGGRLPARPWGSRGAAVWQVLGPLRRSRTGRDGEAAGAPPALSLSLG